MIFLTRYWNIYVYSIRSVLRKLFWATYPSSSSRVYIQQKWLCNKYNHDDLNLFIYYFFLYILTYNLQPACFGRKSKLTCLNCSFNRRMTVDTSSPVDSRDCEIMLFVFDLFQLRGLKEHNSSLVAKAVTGMNSKDKMQNMFARCYQSNIVINIEMVKWLGKMWLDSIHSWDTAIIPHSQQLIVIENSVSILADV